MNELITYIFNSFIVDGKSIPVKYLRYDGHDNTYITWMEIDADRSFSGDNQLLGYVSYYDFDIFSKGNYINVIEKVKEKLTANGFVWQVSRSSPDFYEADTGYYHKTLCFAYMREESI